MGEGPILQLSGEIELGRKLLPLKMIQQETDFSCGGASARMLLDYFGLLRDRTEDEISAWLGTRFEEPYPGTHPDRMIEFLRSEELAVISGENGTLEMIYDAIDEGSPVMVLDSTWGGHWRLITGYEICDGVDDWMRNKLYIADPEYRMDIPTIDNRTGITVQNARQFYKQWYENRLFERTWERFYIIASL